MAAHDPLRDLLAQAARQAAPMSLKDATDANAQRKNNPAGRLPAEYYGWGDDNEDPEHDERIEEAARRALQTTKRGL